MEIRNRETGEVTTVSELKAQHPNTSFPKQITAEVLDGFGYDTISEGAQATVTASYGISVRDGVEQIDGQWYTKYIAGPVFTDITDDDDNVVTAATQEATYRAGIDADVAERVRTKRNQKLTSSDWTQLADNTANTSAWATYRQALRDLPATEGFPHNITWPTEP